MGQLNEVFFVVNANVKIGTGHLKRCLLLAEEFSSRKIKCSFAFFDTSVKGIALLKDSFSYSKFDNVADFTNRFLEQLPSENCLLFFDTDAMELYAEDFQNRILKTQHKFIYMSIKSGPKYKSHYFFNQNIMALSERYDTESYTIKLLGPSYFILDNSFQSIQPNHFDKRQKKNLLITLGGSDPENNTEKIVSLLENFKHHFNKIRIVVGGMNTSIDAIHKLEFVVENPDQVEVYYNSTDMYGLMKKTDLAITSLGMSLWELTLHKIPCMVISGSIREKSQIGYFCANNHTHFIGNFDDNHWEHQWYKQIELFFESPEELKIDELYQTINVNGKSELVQKILSSY